MSDENESYSLKDVQRKKILPLSSYPVSGKRNFKIMVNKYEEPGAYRETNDKGRASSQLLL